MATSNKIYPIAVASRDMDIASEVRVAADP